MYTYKDSLIGHLPNLEREFLSASEKCRTKENQRSDYDSSIKVYYDLNSYGHRCKPLTELSDNYILFTGCSFTLGQGVPIEKSYPYLLASHYNTDYYNLALSGCGIDSLFYNVVSFINKVKTKPKKLFIQWPVSDRTLFYHNDISMMSYAPVKRTGQDSGDRKIYETMLAYDYPMNQYPFYKKLTLDNLSSHNIEYHEISDFIEFYLLDYYDFARDGRHPGVNTHNIWANKIIETIDKKI